MNEAITSFDAAQPGQFGDILNIQREKTGQPKIGLLGVGYFEYWRMYPDLRSIVEADLTGIKDRLSAHVDVVYPGVVDSMDKAEKAGQAFAKARVDMVVVIEGTYLPDFMVMHVLEHVPDAQVILFNTQTGENVNPGDDYQATLRNSALIGITQLSGSLNKAKRSYEVVVGESSQEVCYQQINRIVRAHSLRTRLRRHNIGLVGHVFRGMFDLEFDKGSVRGILGPEVITIQVDHLIDIWKEVPAALVNNCANELVDRFTIRDVTRDDIERSVRLGIAMERLAEQYKLDSLCFLGQHYIEKITGAPARIGASLMLEKDFMVACEGDVGGLVMMEMMHELTGNIPVQMEWGQFDQKHNALFLLGHGIASASLAETSQDITLTPAPEEWGFEGNGINLEMIAKPGPVTLGHLMCSNEGWRMLISKGDSTGCPKLSCNEIHAMVGVQSPVTEYLESLIKLGVTHHVIMVHGDCQAELELIAEKMHLQYAFIE